MSKLKEKKTFITKYEVTKELSKASIIMNNVIILKNICHR
jgi:hypothetical protein